MNELYLIGVVFGGSGERERERVIYTYMVEWFNQNTSKSQRQAQEWEINLFWCKKRKKKKKGIVVV